MSCSLSVAFFQDPFTLFTPRNVVTYSRHEYRRLGCNAPSQLYMALVPSLRKAMDTRFAWNAPPAVRHYLYAARVDGRQTTQSAIKSTPLLLRDLQCWNSLEGKKKQG